MSQFSSSTQRGLLARARAVIEPVDRQVAESALARVLERDERAGGVLAVYLSERPHAALFLEGVFGSSPYLTDLAARDPGRLAQILEADPFETIDRLIEKTRAQPAADEAELMRLLRLVKQEAALVAALADLGKAFTTQEAARALTRFADATLSAAVAFVLREAATSGQLELADKENPETGCGWIFLAMGKLGAFELNYSSDIDLVVLFDRRRVRAVPHEDVDLFVRLTKRVVKIMSERTPDGYVFRVDLRLRPDPGATPIAIPLEAAFGYYESMGQNWERAAFIKARPVAGDIEAGWNFLAELGPFVWRKHLDFAAIADVHSIKRQIHAFKGHGKVAVLGHDIKLGRGGIREIEFFVQTQQLIAGGRDHTLRGRETLPMLGQLAASGWIEPAARDDLREAYLFLRDVEHRIQMVADEQKHSLPDDERGVLHIGRMMGFATLREFSQALRRKLEKVQGHSARLFETASELSSGAGNLVFTGDDDDPDTIENLSRLGFKHPKTVTETIRGWHFGRYAATRSTLARERLTELTPALLEALGATDNADQAFLSFDRLIGKLPAGVQLFALLAANPRLLHLLAEIVGAAPKLAETISRRPRVIDALLEPAFFERLPDEDELAARFATMLGDARAYEEALDCARIFGQEQIFLIGVRVLTGTVSVGQAGLAYARLAGVVISGLLPRVEDELAIAHGRVANGRVAVVAMGKLGGREMTAASDLDLMLLYDVEPEAESVGGERPLAGAHYYARLTQRLIAALSAPTAQGLLYEVDFRLRPSGNKGPIAVALKGFEDYQANEAWTWEHMALTRARVVAGPSDFVADVEAAIRAALVRRRDLDKLRADVLHMRRRLEHQKGAENPWEIKQVRGGLIDIEFITQYLLLRHASAHPDILATATAVALRRLADRRLLDPAKAETLIAAARLYQGLTQVLRLASDHEFRASAAPRGLVELLLRAGELPDLGRLEAHLIETQKAVRALFVEIVGE